jgi:hypothetical protein
LKFEREREKRQDDSFLLLSCDALIGGEVHVVERRALVTYITRTGTYGHTIMFILRRGGRESKKNFFLQFPFSFFPLYFVRADRMGSITIALAYSISCCAVIKEDIDG